MGARMIPFGEWEMPERYTSIIEEHHATRLAAGLFDLSHMGEIYVSGAAAAELAQYLLANDISALPVDAALYSPMCNDDGGIVDDLIVYHLGYAANGPLAVALEDPRDRLVVWEGPAHRLPRFRQAGLAVKEKALPLPHEEAQGRSKVKKEPARDRL